MSKLSKANAALDKACKDHGQDPVAVRMAMASVILTNAAQQRAAKTTVLYLCGAPADSPAGKAAMVRWAARDANDRT